jgi:hypothetical protein
MKPQELHIGNWVHLKDKGNYQIDSGHDIDEILTHEGTDYCTGIPLTEEWLHKFGFENIGTDDYHSKPLYKKDGCEWNYCLSGYFSQYFCEGHSEPAIVGDIEYIHQLQNLYFALTGTELTIKEKAPL